MAVFLIVIGMALLLIGIPASIVLTAIFSGKNKTKAILSAICIPISSLFSLVLLGVGGYLYGQTNEYKEKLARQEAEIQEIEEQERAETENQNSISVEEYSETSEQGDNITEEETEDTEIFVDEMTEEEYKEQCEELWYDDIFFSEESLKGHHVRLEVYVEEWRYFEKFTDQTTMDFINEYNLQRDLFACGVSRGEPNSYVGGQISLYFSDDYGYKQSDYETGQELIIYGEIVRYSTNTWDGYNACGVIPRYIEKK